MMSSTIEGMINSSFHSFLLVLAVITVILHLVMAGGVAKDIGQRQSKFYPIHLIPGYAWILAVLISGLWALGMYWLIHHSTLAVESRRSTTLVSEP